MTASIESLLQAPFLAGAVVRSGKDADRIDGIRPTLVVEPRTAAEVAELLASASRERLTVVFRGGGTKLGWGRVPAPIDLLISMRGMSRVIAHEHADLTATVEAGATLDELNAALATHRQWLPLDGASDGATIGGAIASNDSGPLRHRFGTPRDLLIGIQLATTDGRVVRAGGNVVKNVAGYDLGKLVSGSFGSLAGIVTATFKLLPVPRASSTLSASFESAQATALAVTVLTDSQLEATAMDVHAAPGLRDAAPYRLLVRFATAPAATRQQVADARALLGTGEVIAGDAETALWGRYQRRSAASAGTVVRMAWLPAALSDVLALVDELRQSGGTCELAARAAVGAGVLRLDGSEEWQASAVRQLRARGTVVRHVTIQDAPPPVKQMVDVWEPGGAARMIGDAVKRALDPAGILNAGRGPV